MASINITKEEWPDLIVAFLLDKMIDGDNVLGENDDFNNLMEIVEKRGLKPYLLHYYMGSDSNVRSKYKSISKSFKTGKTDTLLLQEASALGIGAFLAFDQMLKDN